jgi:hypothetical protein
MMIIPLQLLPPIKIMLIRILFSDGIPQRWSRRYPAQSGEQVTRKASPAPQTGRVKTSWDFGDLLKIPDAITATND